MLPFMSPRKYRELVAEIAQLLDRVSTEQEVFPEDRLRREFREYATSQRTLLSDADRLAEQIDSERATARANVDEWCG